MIKRDELSNPNSCLNKAYDDEPLFVLRAKDLCAVETILRWIELRKSCGKPTSDEKFIEARKLADMMTKWFVAHNNEQIEFKELTKIFSSLDYSFLNLSNLGHIGASVNLTRAKQLVHESMDCISARLRFLREKNANTNHPGNAKDHRIDISGTQQAIS